MTTTKQFSGYDEGKPASRVLHPPGGGSSNIFGDPEVNTRQPAKRNHQASDIFGSGDQQPSGAGAGGARREPQPQQSQPPAQGKPEIYNRNRQKKQDDAPYASYGTSIEDKDVPFQRNAGSQNGADFRCHSVSVYRDAVAQNAEVRQRARGQASSSINPITHEEYHERGPYQQPPPPQPKQQEPVMRRGHVQEKRAFNPITGEEIIDPSEKADKTPAEAKKPEAPSDDPPPVDQAAPSVDQTNPTDNQPATDTPAQTTDTPAQTTDTPAQTTDTPAQAPDNQGSPGASFRPSSKVLQPPGGASTPLW